MDLGTVAIVVSIVNGTLASAVGFLTLWDRRSRRTGRRFNRHVLVRPRKEAARH